ncbi:hypothetical protein B4U80_15016 [Leptotrombidium deliense]|uniref:Uncharacterized protein n=1 Tax=Leptotrombidium deliense TaxID=299467 RepID=A0A443RTA5_9ACAR|nr:hypothetical protein B4U80_15016 [Leptotrombidium deliense]
MIKGVSIAVFEETVYWSNYHLKNIFRVYDYNKTRAYVKVAVMNAKSMMDLKIVHEKKQPLTANRCESNACSHLCLPHNEHCYTCVCPLNYMLSADGVNCINNKSKIKKTNRFSGISKAVITESQKSFPICSNGDIVYEVSTHSNMAQSEETFSRNIQPSVEEPKNKKHTFSILPYLFCILIGVILTTVAFFAYKHFRKSVSTNQLFDNHRFDATELSN